MTVVSKVYARVERTEPNLDKEVAKAVATVVTTLAATELAVDFKTPRSVLSATADPLLLEGMNLVQNNAIRSPRSITRCFKMNSTTRKKNTRPAMMRSLSIRSAFSRAVTSCLEIERTLSSVSCVEEVARSVAVDESVIQIRSETGSETGIRTEHLSGQD